MNQSFLIKYLLPAFCLLIFDCTHSKAQNVVFSANASAGKVGLLDQFQVTFTLQDAQNIKTLRNPSFKDFKVLGGPFQSQSSNTMISGNRMTQTQSFSVTFILQANHTGAITIAPAMADDGAGHTFQSNPIKIEVVAGSVQPTQQRRAMPSASLWDDDPFSSMRPQQMVKQAPKATEKPEIGNAIFIRVNVDKKAVKIGEQITAIYKLYSRIPMQVAISKLPSLNGFWNQDFEIPKQQKPVEEIVNGQKYQTFILKKSALFPQQVGQLTLDVAEAQGTAQVPVQTQHRSLFDDPFFQQAFGGTLMMNDPFFRDPFSEGGFQEVPVHLKSNPINIEVSDLPEKGKPKDFTGAVGTFSVAGKLDRTALSTDDVASLQLTIAGSGNLKLFTAPKLQLPSGLDTYEPNVFDTIMGRTTTISGKKLVTYSISPKVPGEYTIPPITLSWYDPETGTYKTSCTPSYHLTVKKGKGLANAVNGEHLRGDINDHLLVSAAKPLVFSPFYWSMYAFPLFLLVGASVYRKRADESTANTFQYRNKKANKVAQKRLALAGILLKNGDARGFYDEISKSIWLYLSDKMNIPISKLGKDTAKDALIARKVPVTIQEQVDKILNECEMALYASSGTNHQMQQTFSEAANLITQLERILQA